MTEQQRTSSKERVNIDWRWKAFGDLTNFEVYDVLAARAAVFVIEQNCLYGDIDGLDTQAWHLIGYGATEGAQDAAVRPKLAGYLRVLLPDTDDTDIRIGRVLTTAEFRGQGLGNAMMERTLQHIRAQWPDTPVRLHAQAHLQPFYGAFGFKPVSDVHEEDGIPHIWMRSQ
jgi:ElaA protein